MKQRITIFTACLLGLAACDGPQEDRGEVTDNAAGVVSSEDAIESGPNETLGEARDDAAESANEAREAQADALEDQADQAREEADQRAEALEDQAEKARGR
ncbi:hypothetical protein [Sphingomonas lenta]|uniref:Uncharacterized protein n=1 Tax=Sphingomonas lenta TaxID=1141887 RepID=A0A2A2SEG2_9SPHN|nr:hypothetical protein [Sphingomonas lenta]PAX07572.1 hypothetical protein CKY28_07905 [Sphingomonas lenta]